MNRKNIEAELTILAEKYADDPAEKIIQILADWHEEHEEKVSGYLRTIERLEKELEATKHII